MSSFIVLLGPPGAGKGTQAEAISATLHLPHISSGDIFRETIAMIHERLSRPDCHAGALLDGFPRTPPQAEALDAMLVELKGQVKHVPYICVPEDVLIERLTGRWTCRASGHIFHERYNPPRQKGLCDIDGSELYQREDDQAETVKRRIRVYLEQTQPLIDYYTQRHLLVEVDGKKPIQQVTKDLLAALQGNGKS
jgi:adenylate kinase